MQRKRDLALIADNAVQHILLSWEKFTFLFIDTTSRVTSHNTFAYPHLFTSISDFFLLKRLYLRMNPPSCGKQAQARPLLAALRSDLATLKISRYLSYSIYCWAISGIDSLYTGDLGCSKPHPDWTSQKMALLDWLNPAYVYIYMAFFNGLSQ